MVTIQLKFLTGRWHATPWGRQVNEGAVEWPPAPWRILRALIAVWHHKCADIPEVQMRDLIDTLTPLPVYHLPAATQGHTRHYMPIEKNKTTKIFDTFITLDRDKPVTICWQDVMLDEHQTEILSRLLLVMSYFGRAESWVDAMLVEDWAEVPNSFPVDHTLCQTDQKETERVRLLVATNPQDHLAWHEKMLESQLQEKLTQKKQVALKKGKDAEKVKLSQKDRQTIEAGLPVTLFDALHAETGDLRKAGWNRPPGSEFVQYLRPKSVFDSLPRQKIMMRDTNRPTVARYAIASNVRPLFTEAIAIGERIRTILMGCSKKVSKNETSSFTFSGKTGDGAPSIDCHQHAHFICESCKEDGRISHVTVFAPVGFSMEDELALSRLQKVWGSGGHDLQLVLLGIGQPKDLGGTNEKAGQSPILASSKVWVSRTPFVSPHHLRIRKPEQKAPVKRTAAVQRELEKILRKEMEHRDWLTHSASLLEQVEPMLDLENNGKDCGTKLGGRFTRWIEFRRQRLKGEGQKGNTTGYGFRLTFQKPVHGPFLLGYGCHFGLGQFVPEE